MTDTISPHASAPPGRLRRTTGLAFAYLIGLFSLGVVVQVSLAGAGVFGIDNTDVSQATSFDLHRLMGNLLGITAVLLLLIALVARISKRVIAGTFALALLTEVAQHGLAEGGVHHHWLGALHAADGAIILLLACWLTLAAWPGRRRAAR